MVILIKIVQLLLSLSILVIFHEFGHFITARIFKARVEKFYLFFDPWFSLFKFKKGDTEYGVGWIPLGGYCKISGMIDESMDKEHLKQPPQPWEFRSKPAWQRLIIMLGGVTVNVILAIFIYIAILSVWGEQYLPTSEVKYGITANTMGKEIGLQNGDRILTVDKNEVEAFNDIPKQLALEQAKTIQIVRDGKNMDIHIPSGFVSRMSRYKPEDFISVRYPFEAGKFVLGSVAEKAGMKLNDRIIGINDSLFPYFDDFRIAIQRYKNQKVDIRVVRGGDTIKLPLTIPSEGKIGVYHKDLSAYFKLKEKSYNFFTAIPAGFSMTFDKTGDYLKSIKLLFKQEKAYESVGGFISIGSLFPDTWNWLTFWSWTAFLSIMLAVINVLPIPALDGGHVMFLLYEIIFRRKPSDKFMEYAQITGMVILFGLLIFANLNDVVKLFR
jgi:regulator of sigma E protease